MLRKIILKHWQMDPKIEWKIFKFHKYWKKFKVWISNRLHYCTLFNEMKNIYFQSSTILLLKKEISCQIRLLCITFFSIYVYSKTVFWSPKKMIHDNHTISQKICHCLKIGRQAWRSGKGNFSYHHKQHRIHHKTLCSSGKNRTCPFCR